MAKRRASRGMHDGVVPAVTHRRRCRAPALTALLVPKIEHFAHGIADRVVVPGRETKELTVLCPRARRPALADEESAPRVGDDIRPWRRGNRVAAHAHDIVATCRDTTEAIVEAKRFVNRGRRADRIRQPFARART